MADEHNEVETAAAFLIKLREGVRQELDAHYAERLRQAREQVRYAQDVADSTRICASQEQEQMAARMAEYRRGKWYHLGAVVASAASGFAVGYLAQKTVDLRIRGVPVAAAGGLPGLILGARLDEGMAARASLAVGGTMFTIGTITYVLFHPLPPEEKIA